LKRPLRPATGFTLVELMVAIVLTALLVLAALSSMFNVERSWDASQEQIDVTQNTRAALEMLARDVRMAGSGFGGRTLTTGGVPGNRLHVLEPTPAASGPDTLHMVGSLEGTRGFTAASMPSPSAPLVLDDATGFEIDDLVAISGRGEANLFQVTGVDPNGREIFLSATSAYNRSHDSWPAGGYPPGSRVTKVERISYWVDEEDGITVLYRRVDTGEPVPIAYGVDNLAIRYVLADGTTSGNPPDPSLIRSVEIEYLGEPVKDAATRQYTYPQAFQVRIQPRVLG